MTFTVRLTNTGVVPLVSLAVTDTFDANVLALTAASLAPDGQSAGVLTWTTSLAAHLPLPAGAGVTLTLAFRGLTPTATAGTTNTVTAAGQDGYNRTAGPLTAQAPVWLVNGRLGDRVWLDDGDGVQEPAETTGLNGVPIHVTGLDMAGASIDITVTTSFTGYYSVENLLPGVYTATAPAGLGGTYTPSTPTTHVFTLTVAAPQNLDMDFGYTAPTGLTLARFTAAAQPGQVSLSWALQGVAPSASFHVLRGDNPKSAAASRISKQPVFGGPDGGFSFVDAAVKGSGVYWYWLEDIATGQRFGPQEVIVFGNYLFLPMTTGR